MRFLPRRRKVEIVQQSPQSADLTPRLERAILALAVHAQQLDDRLGKLETDLKSTSQQVEHLPSHADVLAVRIHSAQVLTELAAVSMELRNEIAQMRLTPQTDAPVSDIDPRVRVVAEQIVDLSDSVDTRLEDTYRDEPTSFIRPDADEFRDDTIDLNDDSISWGPAPSTSNRS